MTLLDSIFKPFVEKSPICVMAAGALRRLLSAERLDALFERARVSQYAHQLLFSSTFELMGSMVSGSRKTVHHAYQTAQEPVGVSVVAVYGKLKGIEPCTSQALVREVGAEVSSLIDQFGQVAQGGQVSQASGEGASLPSQPPAPLYPPVLPGYHTRILDGNCIEATHHRIKELRTTAAGALPGKSLVVLDADRRVICDVFPCEDGHAQERALLGEVIPTIKPKDLWIDDRNFCTFEMLWETNARGAFFVTRRHGNMVCDALGERRLVGRTETGTVYEQAVLVRGEGGRELRLRRVDVELDKPARDGDKVLSLLSNLPAEGAGAVDALAIAEIYRKRWGIETAFQELAGHFQSEINSLGYPRAALFGFCVALVLFNAVSLMRAALAATHGAKKVQEEVSSYYIAAELETTSRGMMIAVPSEQWEVFAKMTDAEFIAVMMMLAGKLNLRHFKKHPRGPKKSQPKRTYDPAHPHVATAKILAKRSPRKRRAATLTNQP